MHDRRVLTSVDEGERARVQRRTLIVVVISQVLGGKYPGQTGRLQRLVEGYYLGATVDCPVLGELSRAACEHHQVKPFAATNPQRVALFRACRGCPHATGETDHE